MNLEERVAQWVDLGLMPYQEVYSLQTRLADMRKDDKIGDIVLQVQHPYEINFGSALEHNQFSNEFLQEIKDIYGENYTQGNVVDLLSKQGIKFSETSRGGGATVVGPGQYIFYPIVSHSGVTRSSLNIDVSMYKKIVDEVMFDTLEGFGVPNIEIASGKKGERERRDVWFINEGRSYKIGSKGIKFVGDVAYHGFVLYMDKLGLKHFNKVNPCGYNHNEVSVISAEEVLGKKIESEKIISSVKSNLAKYFNYNKIEEISKSELYNLAGIMGVTA